MQKMANSSKLGITLSNFAAVGCVISLLLASWITAAATSTRPAPPFTHAGANEWLNSQPLTLKALRGRVLLIDFWTFDCWNCYRSFPWLQGLETELRERPFTVIGVHTPEFEHERDKDRLQEKIAKFGLEHPIMIDNDFSYWNAMGTRYWPSYYLIDKWGRVRNVFIGETRIGSPQAARIEAAVKTLLAEEVP